MTDRPRHPQTTAALVQLAAEIAAHGQTVKSTAGLIGIDYNTYRRYVLGEREMPLDVLTRSLEVLGLDYPTFAARARGRLSALTEG